MTIDSYLMDAEVLLNNEHALLKIVKGLLPEETRKRLIAINSERDDVELTNNVTISLVSEDGVVATGTVKLSEFTEDYNVPVIIERCLKMVGQLGGRVNS